MSAGGPRAFERPAERQDATSARRKRGGRRAFLPAGALRPSRAVPARIATGAALALVLALAFALRATGGNWDDGAHLHPDERYMSMVADAIRWPGSPAEYLDVERSPLSPYNTDTGVNYLYGQLPLFATKAVAALTGRDTYDELHLVGRLLSALVDTLSVVLAFLLARLLLARAGPRAATAGGLLAAALYACTVTAIQHAHFFTVESWLVLLTLAAFYTAARAGSSHEPSPLAFAGVGAVVGLALAAKVSAAFVLVPVGVALALAVVRLGVTWPARAVRAAACLLSALAGAYVAFRAVSPYAFEHSSWLRIEPSESLRAALETQRLASTETEVPAPPGWQWFLRTPVVDPLHDLVMWALGPFLGLVAVAAVSWLTVVLLRRQPALLVASVPAAMLVAYVLVTFGYVGSRWAHSLRYLLPLAPFLCVATAVALVALHRRDRLAGTVAGAAVVAATLLYAVAFVQVYRAPNTRITATRWIERTVPAGSTIASEHWDDTLPVGSPPERYTLLQLPVFAADDETKLRVLYDVLAEADLYALSSPRAWKTIGRLPDRFPLMARFYRALAEGRLGFREAARFTSRPRLLGIELDDLEAEETFWVYDHPPVLLYRRAEPPSWPRFQAAVCGGEALPGCA